MNKKTERVNVPAAALTFTGGEMQLGDNGEGAKTVPVKLKARTGQPIDHWFWGRIVHDLAGMKLHKKRLPLDYAHDEKEVVGYLSHFETESGDLHASGAVIPFTETDRAAEIIHKSKNGVPYEASINFGGDDLQLEEIDDGETCQVNGYEFSGPGVVVRSWPLRGVAVCPYGADAGTSTEFASGSNLTIEFQSTEGFKMSKRRKTKPEQKPNAATNAEPETVDALKQEEYHDRLADEAKLTADETPADETPAVAEAATDEPAEDATAEAPVKETPAEAIPAEATASDDRGNEYRETQPADADRADLAATFTERFGPRGIEYFAAGLSVDQAATFFERDLREANEKLETENNELRQRLSAAELGSDPVEFARADAKADRTGDEVTNLADLWKSNRKR